MNYLKKASEIIRADEWMMNCLRTVEKLQLNDWYIGAGFVRNKIWDVLHNHQKRTPLNDVDVVYFDKSTVDKSFDLDYEKQLVVAMPGINWSVTNLARIHLKYDQAPFNDSTHAISFWPELPTCIGVKLESDRDQLSFTAPWGIEVNFSLEVKPNLANSVPLSVYRNRVESKQWQKIWPKLTIE
jgi:hypothetical protein